MIKSNFITRCIKNISAVNGSDRLLIYIGKMRSEVCKDVITQRVVVFTMARRPPASCALFVKTTTSAV